MEDIKNIKFKKNPGFLRPGFRSISTPSKNRHGGHKNTLPNSLYKGQERVNALQAKTRKGWSLTEDRLNDRIKKGTGVPPKKKGLKTALKYKILPKGFSLAALWIHTQNTNSDNFKK